MSSLLKRDNAIVAAVGATTLAAKKGYLVTLSTVSSVLTATLSASATTKAQGVVIEGTTTSAKSTIGILGALKGTVHMKLGGTVAAGAFVQQHTDGSVITDAGSGARVLVGVCLEGGAVDDLVEVAPLPPLTLS